MARAGPASRVVGPATCLGCGCACDDIQVVVEGESIREARRACPLGVAWFGDGSAPRRVRVGDADAALDQALDRLAGLIGSGGALVYLAPELSAEAQRLAVGIADVARARLDSVTSDTVANGILAAQRRGRAAATLGEVRNRAELIVYWAVDPGSRYPRFDERYGALPEGTHVPAGRAGRTLVAVDVGKRRGPADVDLRLALDDTAEVDALGLMRALALGRELGPTDPALAAAVELARRLAGARYVALVHDAEPAADGGGAAAGDPAAVEGLIALAQALNGPTRCALITLRGGGNRSGADVALTMQTGFPFAVDLNRGYPRYRPEESAAALLASRRIDRVLVVGDPRRVPTPVAERLGAVPTAVVGPFASDAPFPTALAVDTAVAGIHEGGIAYRMDDVPLPLRPALDGPPAAVQVLEALAARLAARRGAEVA